MIGTRVEISLVKTLFVLVNGKVKPFTNLQLSIDLMRRQCIRSAVTDKILQIPRNNIWVLFR